MDKRGLVIREEINGHMVCANPSHQVVDLYFNTALIQTISSRDQHGEATLLCVHWEGQYAYVSALSLLGEGGFGDEFFSQAFYEGSRSVGMLIQKVFDTCGLMMSRVVVHPFSIEFHHDDKQSLKTQSRKLRKVLTNFFAHSDSSFDKLGFTSRTSKFISQDCQHPCESHFCTKERSTNKEIISSENEERFAKIEEEVTEQGTLMDKLFSRQNSQMKKLSLFVYQIEQIVKAKISEEKSRISSELNTRIAQSTSIVTDGVQGTDTNQCTEQTPAKTDDKPSNGSEKISQEGSKERRLFKLPEHFQFPKSIPSSSVEDYRKTQRDTGVTIDQLDPNAVFGDPRSVILSALTREATIPQKAAVSKVKLGMTKSSQEAIINLLNIPALKADAHGADWEGVEAAFNGDQGSTVPKTGTDTIVCIHTSGGLDDTAFEGVKEIVFTLLGGLEDIASKHGYRENVGLVASGNNGIVLKHLSKSYVGIRETLASISDLGSSSLTKALIFSLACLTKGGLCKFGSISVTPRLLFMTDGIPEEDIKYGEQSVQSRIMEVMRAIGSDHVSKILLHPVIWIPIGNANRDLLKDMAAVTNGQYLEGRAIKNLVPYQKIERVKADVLAYMQSTGVDPHHEDFTRAFEACGQALDPDEKILVADFVAHKLCRIYREHGELDNFHNIVLREDLPPLGSRVMQGPDWKHGEKDSGVPGTIINHGQNGDTLWVLWDNNRCGQYGYSGNAGYHLLVTDQPRRTQQLQGLLPIGVQVERGPHWRYAEEDGGQGSYGVVIRRSRERVKVRWENGSIHNYAYSDSVYEVWPR